ncbi:MAG: clostripain-related cysteine peptidase [Mangrovibacterium sp.]|nr:clostripain-related cysteine peptidase [Mangrovibacterium sp.]
MNRFAKILPLLSVIAVLFTGCWWKHGGEDKEPYTILVYMAADNSLDGQVDYSLNQLKQGIRNSNGTVVIYLDREDDAPRLFKLSPEGQEIGLKDYLEENSADASTLARVINETRELVPSEKFGLVIWSHSMGWVPDGYGQQARITSFRANRNYPRTRYVSTDTNTGGSGSGALEIKDMAAKLLPGTASFILFDVCLMANVEALYEIRHACDYVIASPTEVLAEAQYNASGMPYAKVLPLLFGDVSDLAEACETCYNYYKNLYVGGVDIDEPEMLRSTTISLIDMKELDGLYSTVKGILNGKLSQAEVLNVGGFQTYHTISAAPVFFDMGDVVGALSNTAQSLDFQSQLNRAVLYKAATEKFIYITIDPEHFSGLSMYVPLTKWKLNKEYTYYFGLDWAGVYE